MVLIGRKPESAAVRENAPLTYHDTSLDSAFPPFLRNIGSRLPFWPTAILAGVVPVLGLLVVEDLFVPFDIINAFLSAYWIVSVVLIYFIYAMKFSWSRVEKLVEYAGQMSRNKAALRIHTPLRPSWILLAWLSVLGGITLLFGLPDFSEHVLVLGYFFLVTGSFLLVYGYSMLVIYRAGNLPLELKSFTEDRTLGLAPFGTISLRLASVYAIFPIVDSIVNTISINAGPAGVDVKLSSWRLGDIALTAILVFVGVGLFFLPLLTIHRRLIEAKRGELMWINPQYSNVIRRMKEADQNEHASFADELSLIRQIQSDIHRIQEWPFTLGVITRLATVLFLPPILALAGRKLIQIVLNI